MIRRWSGHTSMEPDVTLHGYPPLLCMHLQVVFPHASSLQQLFGESG